MQLHQVPLESGWLTDETPLQPGPNQHAAAPWAQYTGDRSRAFWHLTRDLALANENFRREQRGKKLQMVACGLHRKLLPAEWIIPVPFEPGPDGQTVSIDAGFLSVTPPTAANSGIPLGHASGPVQLSLIGGWGGGNQQTGAHEFRTAPGLFGPSDSLIVLAYHPGDRQYSYTEAACQVKFPKFETGGAPQTIEFAPLADRSAGPVERTFLLTHP